MAGAAAAEIHSLGSGGNSASAWTSAAPHPQTNTQDTREALDPQHSTTSCAAYVHYALCNRTMCLSSVTQARAARARTSDTRDTSQALHKSHLFSNVLPPRPSSLERHCVGQSGGGNLRHFASSRLLSKRGVGPVAPLAPLSAPFLRRVLVLGYCERARRATPFCFCACGCSRVVLWSSTTLFHYQRWDMEPVEDYVYRSEGSAQRGPAGRLRRFPRLSHRLYVFSYRLLLFEWTSEKSCVVW